MNFKKFITMAVVFVVLLCSAAFAQTTFFVNNMTGNDANSGLSTSQAKKTLNSAMIAAPSGSIISVAYTTVNYIEPNITIASNYTLTSTGGGTPVFVNASLTLGTVTPASADTLTFTGAFEFDGGLILNNGAMYNGNNLTIKGNVYRNELCSIKTGQLNYIGTSNFVYENKTTAAGAIITTGFEFPTDAVTAVNVTTLSTAGTLTLKLDQNRTMNGLLTTAGPLNLNTFQLNLNTGALAHTIGGDVTGGTMYFTLTAGASINGAFKLANVTVDAASAQLFFIGNTTQPTLIGNLVVNTKASVGAWIAGNAGNITSNSSGTVTSTMTGSTVGNVTLNASGPINATVAAAGSFGDVLTSSTGSGTITLNTGAAGAVTVNSVTMSGTGTTTFGANVNSIVVTVNVLTNTSFTYVLASAGSAVTSKGLIIFTSVPVAIGGTLTNSAQFAGNTDQANGGNGVISFGNNTVSVTGATLNNVQGTVTFALGGSADMDGNILFANANFNLIFTAITNSAALTSATTNSGLIRATAGGTGNLTATVVLNNSSYAGANIDFSVLTGINKFTSLTESGTGTGGAIKLGNGSVVSTVAATGVDFINSRGASGADIIVGTAGTSTTTITANNINNSGKSNITFNSTLDGNVTVKTAISQTGTGTISFPSVLAAVVAFSAPQVTVSNGNLTFSGANATFAFNNLDVTGGVLTFGNGTGAVNFAVMAYNNGTHVYMTKGKVDFGNLVRTVTIAAPTVKIGDVGSKVDFTTTAINTVLMFNQTMPNILQTITLGTLDQTFPGSVQVANVASTPAPYVIINSAAGSAGNPGNLYVLNGVAGGAPVVANAVTFNTGTSVVNTIQLDNARIYIGQNNGSGTGYNGGGFYNETGYTTVNGGFVMMAGGFGAAQVVTGPATHTGVPGAPDATFGNFGVANNTPALVPCVTFTNKSIMTNDFYLAAGAVLPTNLWFNGPLPYPTIYRTEGYFTAAITATNITPYINVTYYGNDKTTSYEVPDPALSNSLWNLTVATTNGAKSGYGIIKMTGNITVNGTLNIFTNQALYTAANTLTIAGASAIVNGYLVDNGTTPPLVWLANTTGGTTFTGTGILPSILVKDNSAGNTITGYAGLYKGYFGANGVWGGGDDNTTNANGVITYAAVVPDAGSSLLVGFTGVGPHFGDLTMNSAKETFQLASDVTSSGNILQTGGTINLGGHMFTHNGGAFATNGTALNGSVITNGTLIFTNNPTTLTVAGAPMTISANVQFNVPGGTVTLPAYVAGTTDKLTITGNVTLSDNTGGTLGTTVDIGNLNNLSLGGLSVSVSAHSKFTATTGGTTGILTLYNSGANNLLTFSTPASTQVTNLTVSGNVTLGDGVVGSTLYIPTSFVHTAGLLTFSTTNLQVGGTAALPTTATAATFSRTGATATYSGTGWLIWESTLPAGFSHSVTPATTGAMTINNLKVMQNFTLQNAANLNVVTGLWLIGGTITNQVGGTGGGYVWVGDANNVPMITIDGTSDIATNALQFANPANADFTFTGASATISTNAWPTANAARNVVVNTAAANTTTLAANRTINGNLTLTTGTLAWTTPVVVTLASGSTISRTVTGILNRGTGTFTAPNVNLLYTGGGAFGTAGYEYSDPVVVNNITIDTNGSTITFSTAKTGASAIAGAFSLTGASSIVTFNANTTFNAAQTISAGTLVVNSVGTPGYTLALNGLTLNTLPTVTVVLPNGLLTCAGPLTINGPASGNLTITGALTLNGGHVIAAPNTTAGTITASNNVTVGSSANFDPTSILVFVGSANATLTVPSSGSTIGAVTFSKAANNNSVTLTGGNLTTTGLTTFINGLFLTTTNTFTMWVPLGAFAPGANTQGFTRAGVTPGVNISHVVGNVAKVLSHAGGPGLGGSPEPRQEFPIGSMTAYHLVAVTFNPAFGIPTTPNTTLTVSYTDANPGGTSGLPIADGVATGIDVSKYPNFYWTILSSSFSNGPSTPFDLELTATGFSAYTDIANLRIIRRHGGIVDTQNPWLLQGMNSAYDNSDNLGVPTVIVKDANAGLRIGGALFTLGLTSKMSIKTPIAKQWLVLSQGSRLYNLSNLFKGNTGVLTYVPVSSDSSIVKVGEVGSTLTLTPLRPGDVTVTITGQDLANNEYISFSFPVNVGLTDVQTTEQLPTDFALYQNYPNPFNPTTNIKFDLPKESNVTLKIYNILGEEVTTLVNKTMPAGHQVVTFDASRLASGMYIYRIQAGSFVQVKKMLLMK